MSKYKENYKIEGKDILLDNIANLLIHLAKRVNFSQPIRETIRETIREICSINIFWWHKFLSF